MSDVSKFDQALEKFKESYDLEFNRGYNLVLDKVINGELAAPQLVSYSAHDKGDYYMIRRDLGIRESDLFIKGFVQACKDLVNKLEEKRE